MRVRERKSYRQRVYGKQVETDRDRQRFTKKKSAREGRRSGRGSEGRKMRNSIQTLRAGDFAQIYSGPLESGLCPTI